MLEALLKTSPGALSAETLLEQAWGENADPFTKTVHVTISRLRRKLGEPSVTQTIPGIGYRINPKPHTRAPSRAREAARRRQRASRPRSTREDSQPRRKPLLRRTTSTAASSSLLRPARPGPAFPAGQVRGRGRRLASLERTAGKLGAGEPS